MTSFLYKTSKLYRKLNSQHVNAQNMIDNLLQMYIQHPGQLLIICGLEKQFELFNNNLIELNGHDLFNCIKILNKIESDMLYDFIENVANVCITKCMFLDILFHDTDVVNEIKKICEHNIKYIINDTNLLYISNFIEITLLNASNESNISDVSIINLNLLELNASYNKKITDKSITSQTKLKKIDISHNSKITDFGIKNLVNLHTLLAANNPNLSDYGLTNLLNLEVLDVTGNKHVSDAGLQHITSLKKLNISDTCRISDTTILNNHELTDLFMMGNCGVTNNGLSNMQSLVKLNLLYNRNITDEGICNLHNLHFLVVGSYNSCISDKGIIGLNLELLDASFNTKITDTSVKCMKHISRLSASHNKKITNESIKMLNNIEILNMQNNRKISGGSLNELPYLRMLDASYDTNIMDNDLTHFKFLEVVLGNCNRNIGSFNRSNVTWNGCIWYDHEFYRAPKCIFS